MQQNTEHQENIPVSDMVTKLINQILPGPHNGNIMTEAPNEMKIDNSEKIHPKLSLKSIKRGITDNDR